MKYVVEMVSGGMIYIQSFRRSEIVKGIHIQTHTDSKVIS
jgi:hypothetical protein